MRSANTRPCWPPRVARPLFFAQSGAHPDSQLARLVQGWGIMIAAVTDTHPFAPFQTAWSTDDASREPTSQLIWVTACSTAMQDGELNILSAERSGEVAAVAPFVSRNQGLWRYWTFLGEGLYEP